MNLTKHFERLLLPSCAIATGILTSQVRYQTQSLGVLATSRRWQAAIVLGVVATMGLLILWGWQWRKSPPVWLVRLAERTRRLGALVAALYPLGVFLLASHPVYGMFFRGVWVHAALLWLGAVFSALWLTAGWPRWDVWQRLGGVLPFQAAVYALLWFVAPISRYPLSQGWSEASRYYYASLFFSPRLYGFRVAWPALHPSRYLLQAVPFLFDLPLWAHRAWQAALWIGLTLTASWGIVRRLRLQQPWAIWTTFWGVTLFLLQGPTYYHLLIVVILVVWGTDVQHPKRTLGVVMLASLWAGISRVNWYPMPAILAAAIYFLEVPQSDMPWWRYLRFPLVWGLVGGAAALGSQAFYALVSGNPPQDFGTSFTSDLLWYRLWPNPTSPQGLLPMAVVTFLPVIALLVWRGWYTRLAFWRRFGLWGMALVLFAGGLVVSMKIGGGNNLHNLDSAFALLSLWGVYAFWDRLPPEGASVAREFQGGRAPWGFVVLLMVVPLYWAAWTGGPRSVRNISLAREAINEIRKKAVATAADGGEVLFISERHLLTFGEIEVPLIPEYERTFLMEMAMAHNRAYLAQFRADLAARRFALIVVQRVNLNLQGQQSIFGEENDAWVRGVAAPLLCYYEPVKVWRRVNVQLMAPRQTPNEEACAMMEGE